MFTKGLFLAALATLTANAATVRQMVSQPATAYVATDAAIEADDASPTSCDDSYCFRNTGCISTRWDQQIQEKHNDDSCGDFCVKIGSLQCPECECKDCC